MKNPVVIGAAIISTASVVIVLVLTGNWAEVWDVIQPGAIAAVLFFVASLRKKQGITDEKVTAVAESTARRDQERVLEKADMRQTLNEVKTAATTAAAAATIVAATNVNVRAMPEDTPQDKP